MLPLTVLLTAVLLAAVCAADSPSPVPVVPLNATVLVRARRSASEDKREYLECWEQRQCLWATCSECGGDWDCRWMCRQNCRCGCLEEHRGGMDWDLWEECRQQRGCGAEESACKGSCGLQECRDSCWMDWQRCQCECNWQQAGTTSTTTTTSASTTSTPSLLVSTLLLAYAAVARQCSADNMKQSMLFAAVLLAAVCAAPPGVAADSPSTVLVEPLNATVLVRARRSASEDKREYLECIEKRRCDFAPCSESCRRNLGCGAMCVRNCRCGCLEEHRRGGLNLGLWEKCYRQRGGYAQYMACWDSCGSQECKVSCWMDYERYQCECSWQQAGTTSRASTTSTPSPLVCTLLLAYAAVSRQCLADNMKRSMLFAAVLLAAVCAAPGVAADSSVPVEALDTTVLVRARRSGPRTLQEWTACSSERECSFTVCDECRAALGRSGGWRCRVLCRDNCRCGCFGEHRASLDWDPWWACVERQCDDTYTACEAACHDAQACMDSCSLDRERCSCECIRQQAGNSTAATTSTGTTSTGTTSTGATLMEKVQSLLSSLVEFCKQAL